MAINIINDGIARDNIDNEHQMGKETMKSINTVTNTVTVIDALSGLIFSSVIVCRILQVSSF